MWLAVKLQFLASALIALLAWALVGPVATLSGLLGGLSAAIPSGLFAFKLSLSRGRSAETYPVVFFLGEFIKVGLTALLFGAVVLWEGPKHWLVLILALIVVLKMPLFAMWFEQPAQPVPAAGKDINSQGQSPAAAEMRS